jgi:hypothetical protein
VALEIQEAVTKNPPHGRVALIIFPYALTRHPGNDANNSRTRKNIVIHENEYV